MAVLPRFTSRALPPGAQPGAIQVAAAPGQAAARFALSLQDTIVVARQRQQAIDEVRDRADLAQFESELGAFRTQALLDAQDEGEARGLTDRNLTSFDEFATEQAERFGDREQLTPRVEAAILRNRKPHEARLLVTEHKRSQAAITAVLDDTLANLVLTASRDPAGVEAHRAKGLEALEQNAAAANIAPELLETRKDAFTADIYVGAVRGAIAANPAVTYQMLVAGQLDEFLRDPDAIRKLTAEALVATKGAAEARALNWLRRQPDIYQAAQDLFDGNVTDPELQDMIDLLPIEARSSAFTATITDLTKLSSFRNLQRTEEDRAATEAAEDAIKEFYFDPDLDTADRQAIFDRLRESPHVTPGAVKGMDEFLREGERRQDVDDDVLAAEIEIRQGTILNEVDLVSRMGEEGWRLSADTMRTRLLPMIETQRDDAFKEALAYGKSKLGIPTGTGLLGDMFQDPVNKAAQFEAELREFFKKNPDADLWAFTEQSVKRLESTGNSGAMQALPVMANAYRQALASGDLQKVANARTALIAVMVEGGVIDPVQAARGDFDPLAIIDAQPGAKP